MKYLVILTLAWAQSQGIWKAIMHAPTYKATVQGWVGDTWLRMSFQVQTDTGTYAFELLSKNTQIYLIDPKAKVTYEISPENVKPLSPCNSYPTQETKTWQGKEIRLYTLKGQGWEAKVWWLPLPFSISFSYLIHQEILGHAFLALPSGLPVEILAQDTEGKTLLSWKLESWQAEAQPYKEIPYPIKQCVRN